MRPEVGLRGLTAVSPHCQVHGGHPHSAVIEKAACAALRAALTQRFGKSAAIEPLSAGDARLAQPNRLLVTLTGRIEIDPETGSLYFVSGLNTLRNGCTDLVVPAPPRLLKLPDQLDAALAANLVTPLIGQLLLDRFGP